MSPERPNRSRARSRVRVLHLAKIDCGCVAVKPCISLCIEVLFGEVLFRFSTFCSNKEKMMKYPYMYVHQIVTHRRICNKEINTIRNGDWLYYKTKKKQPCTVSLLLKAAWLNIYLGHSLCAKAITRSLDPHLSVKRDKNTQIQYDMLYYQKIIIIEF